MRVEKQINDKVEFCHHLSFFLSFFLIVKDSSPTKSTLELFYSQNHSIFAIAESRFFEPFVCKLGIAAALAIYDL